MNILLLANSTIAKQGNIGYRIAEVIDGLEKNGHKLTVFARGSKRRKDNIYVWPFIEIISRGLNFTRLYIFDFNHRIIDSRFFELISTVFLFYKKGKKFDIALLYEYMPRLAMSLRRQGVHVITDVPFTPENYKLNNLQLYLENKLPYRSSIDKLEQEAIKNSDQCICTNKITYELIKNKISPYTKAHVCQYTYMENFNLKESIINRNRIIDTKKVNFLFVGNISTRKGMQFILEAWPKFIEYCKLSHEGVQFELNIIGRNHMKIDLNNFQNVKYHGFKRPLPFYLKSHYFLLASLFEGYPKALAEAKACGCIPIVSEAGGASEMKNSDYEVKIENLTGSAVLESLINATEILPRWSKISNLISEKEFTLKKYSEQISSLIEPNEK